MTTSRRPVQGSLLPELVPARAIGPILPSVLTGTNADLIARVAPLYLTGSVLDVTYGNGDTAGGWWRRFQPDPFTFHDLALDGVDFRALPEEDCSVDTVCFDPPYAPQGGTSATTSRVMPYRRRFGLEAVTAYGTEAELFDVIHLGLAECARVARRFVLVKAMEFVSSRVFHDMPVTVANWAGELGLRKHDTIVHAHQAGPGGHNIVDVLRARRHHSYLLVFTRGAGGKN